MEKRTPWTLLHKLAKNQADAIARELARLHVEAERLEAQRVSLAGALAHYALAPEEGAPIGLIRNQLAFRAKLAATLTQLDEQARLSLAAKEETLARWRKAQAKTEAYERLRDEKLARHRADLNQSDAKRNEEVAAIRSEARARGDG